MAAAESADDANTSPPPRRLGSTYSDLFSPRSRKQFSIYLAGAGFLLLSTLITRRSLARRYKEAIPAFYHYNTRTVAPASGAREALEALNIATINIFSLALMTTGGFLWAFDISTVEELRTRVRAGMGIQGTEQNADEDIEEWIATVLSRKDGKERKRAQHRERLQEAGWDRAGRGKDDEE